MHTSMFRRPTQSSNFDTNKTLSLSPHISITSHNHATSIIFVTTYSAVLSRPDAPRDKIGSSLFGPSSSIGSVSGSWLGFFFKVSLFLGVCFGAFYGYNEYVRRNGYAGGGMRMGGGRFGEGLYSSGKRF